MRYKSLSTPNLSVTDLPGWCLRMTGNSFDTKPRPFKNAAAAWAGAKHKHGADEPLPNVPVPVYFYWKGKVDGVVQEAGDVAVYVPGKGIFGTPLRGSGKANRWDPTPAARAKAIGGGAYCLGWSEDLNGVRLVEPDPEPAPAPAPTGERYNVVKPVPGYTNSAAAARRSGSNSTVQPGEYQITYRVAGMLHLKRLDNSGGWWMNPGDNTAPAPAAPAERTYTVKASDSDGMIAAMKRIGISDWKAVARLNNIQPPYVIRPNQVLRLP